MSFLFQGSQKQSFEVKCLMYKRVLTMTTPATGNRSKARGRAMHAASIHPPVWQWMLLKYRQVIRCCLCLVTVTELRQRSVPPSGCASDPL